MRRWPQARVGATLAAALCLAAPGHAAEPTAGCVKTQACAVCHGALGLSVTPDAFNLAGQPVLYVATQLRAYGSGKRAHEVMTVTAKPLSDDDIRELSDGYASLVVEVKAPP